MRADLIRRRIAALDARLADYRDDHPSRITALEAKATKRGLSNADITYVLVDKDTSADEILRDLTWARPGEVERLRRVAPGTLLLVEILQYSDDPPRQRQAINRLKVLATTGTFQDGDGSEAFTSVVVMNYARIVWRLLAEKQHPDRYPPRRRNPPPKGSL